jgi:hypothetical protein
MSTAAIFIFIKANSTQLATIGFIISEMLANTTLVKQNSITQVILDVFRSYMGFLKR